MLTNRDILVRNLEGVANALNKAKRDGKYVASGKSERSLRIDTSEENGKLKAGLYGEDYIEQLIYGRGPTKNGGKGALQKEIRKWLEFKSFASSLSGKSKDSLSWAISKSIHKKGTLAHRGKRQKVDFASIVDRFTKQAKEDLTGNLSLKFRNEILRGWEDGTNTNT